MKTFRLMGMVFVAIFLSVNLVSCSNGNDEPEIPGVPQKPSDQQDSKLCTVSLNLSSIVDVEEMPLGRATAGNDLYAVVIYPTDMYDSFKLSGLFDKTTDIKATLVEGKEYSIGVLAVKDGKNQIFQYENKYFYPFQSEITNELSQVTSFPFSMSPDDFDLKDNTDKKTYHIANIEVFSSVNSNVPKTFTARAGTTIDVPLYRYNAIGTSFKAINMPEGKLHVCISVPYNNGVTTSPEIIVENEDTSVEDVFTFGWGFTRDIEGDGIEATLNLRWVKDENTFVDLEDATIKFKKNIKYAITISADPNTGFTLSANEDAFSTIESYYVVNGEVESAAEN